jgi:hypothetical protein
VEFCATNYFLFENYTLFQNLRFPKCHSEGSEEYRLFNKL